MIYIKDTRTSCANTKKKREPREIQTRLNRVFLKELELQNQTEKSGDGIKVQETKYKFDGRKVRKKSEEKRQKLDPTVNECRTIFHNALF